MNNTGMKMDIHEIKILMHYLKGTDIAEIEIHEGNKSLRITQSVHVQEAMVTTQQQNGPSPSLIEQVSEPIEHIKTEEIHAPMIGKIHLSPSPSAKPYVDIGDVVKVGDILCVIEAMEIFNQVECDKPGKVKERLVEEGSKVEYHQPLFIIEVDS